MFLRVSVVLLATTVLIVADCAGADLESMSVTATRQQRAVADLPGSLTVIERDAIELVAPVHITELLARAPGTWISRGNGQEHLTAIRSPVFTGAGSCGAFYMAEDGVPIRPAGFCNVNQLFEVDATQAQRVELLRGPGTAVHGANALHGVINVISRAPADTPESELAIEGGPHDYARARASYSDRRDAQAWRINLTAAHDGGYKDDSGYEDYRLGWRHDIAGDGWQLASLLSVANLQQETAGYVEGENSYRDNHRRRDNPNPEAFRDNIAVRWHGEFTLPYAEGRRWVVTPFARYQDMRFLQHFQPGQPLEENGATSAGWQAAHYWDGSSAWSAVVGVDGEWADGYLEEEQPLPYTAMAGFPSGLHYDYDVTGTNLAVFANTDWQLLPTLRVDVGIRGERQAYDYDNRMIDGATAADGTPCRRGNVAIPCRYTRPGDREDIFTDYTLDAGAVWQIADRQSVSARWARGFRPPQAAELYRLQAGQSRADLDSEQADSMEIGWRGNWDAVQTQLSLYRMDKKNIIFQDAERRNVTGADSRHTGLEYTVHWQFAENWYAESNGTWAHHVFASNAPLLGLSAGTDIDGNDMVAAPRTLASTRLGWNSARAGTWELEWSHIGKYYLEPTNTYSYSGHDLLNLRWRQQLSPSMHVAARLLNVTDRDYAERADYAFGNYRYFVGEPRSLYLEVGWTFR